MIHPFLVHSFKQNALSSSRFMVLPEFLLFFAGWYAHGLVAYQFPQLLGSFYGTSSFPFIEALPLGNIMVAYIDQ